MYPLLLPHVCAMVTGEDPTTAPFAERYERHLTALTAALGAGPRPARPAKTAPRAGAGPR